MNVFERNLTVLRHCDPQLAAVVREAEGGVLSVAPSRSGMPTASVSNRAIHSAYDPQREARAWAEAHAPTCTENEAVVVFGVGLLYHVEALRRVLPAEQIVAVVVPSLNELRDACAARRIEDWGARIVWVWGRPEQMVETLNGLRCPMRVVSYAPAARLHADVHAHLERRIRERIATTCSGRLHIAVVGPIYGGSLPIARYTASALEALGHRVTWIDHGPHHASYEIFGRLADSRHRLMLQTRFGEILGQLTLARLAEDPPDMILALAQAPLSLPLLDLLRRKRFLTAIWFVENYRHLTYWQQVAGGYDHWFVIQRDPCEHALRRAGAKDIAYLPMAADPSVHRPVVLSDDEQAELQADVSFVGAGYANRRQFLPELARQAWTFKIWGNEWEGATGLDRTIQRGGRRIDTEMCVKVFNATKVNLNLHSWTGAGLDPDGDFVNPRTFELAACGAFQLVDRRTLLPELFEDREMATFDRPEVCVPAIRQWLNEPAARVAYANAARQRVIAHHTYTHRMQTLLSHLGLRQPDRIGTILRGDRHAAALSRRDDASPALRYWLGRYPAEERVELKDLAADIRRRGPTAALSRDELMILMLDEYRQETRDLV